MKITETFIVKMPIGYIFLYKTENGEWYCMDKGGYGTLDYSLQKISQEQAQFYLGHLEEHNIEKSKSWLNAVQDLQTNEINFEIGAFFDAGFCVKIGDSLNGFTKTETFDRFETAINWLLRVVNIKT